MVEFDPFRSHFNSHEGQLLRSIATASSLVVFPGARWCRGFSEAGSGEPAVQSLNMGFSLTP